MNLAELINSFFTPKQKLWFTRGIVTIVVVLAVAKLLKLIIGLIAVIFGLNTIDF